MSHFNNVNSKNKITWSKNTRQFSEKQFLENLVKQHTKNIIRYKIDIKNGIIYQFSHSVVSDSLWPHESQHARPPCPSPTPGVHPDSRPSSQWCHPGISSWVVPFSSWPQSFPASESFPMSQLFTWGGQRTGVSALASFLPFSRVQLCDVMDCSLPGRLLCPWDSPGKNTGMVTVSSSGGSFQPRDQMQISYV